MATNSKQVLADTIAVTKKYLEDTSVLYKSYTDQLIAQVGDGGETFTTDKGAVQVTQQTQDRLGEDLVVTFDKDKYLSLDRRTQNRLQTLGLVTVARKTISGQAPKVVVRLT